MEKVERMVTRKETYWRTSDGLVFTENEIDDAYTHEFDLLYKNGELKMFDSRGKRDVFQYAETIYIGSTDALKFLLDFAESLGFDHDGINLTSPLGWYFWDETGFVNPQTRIENLITEMNNIIKRCGGEPIE